MANTDKNKEFGSWKEVICGFIKERENNKIIALLSKKDSKKALDDKKQAINIQLSEALKRRVGIEKKDIEEIITRKNTGKNKISKLDFVKQQYNDLNKLIQADESPEKQICELFNEEKDKILFDHKPENWLDYYAKYAGGVSIATHIAKLTHSSIKGASSFYVSKAVSTNTSYLSTSDLRNPIIDSAIDNAAYTPIVNLLNLRHDNETLADLLAKGDDNPFVGLTSDHKKTTEWVKLFQLALTSTIKSSHILAKQVYFPINEKEFAYNLLCNVKSSTMAHAIFGETSSKIKEDRESILNKNKYHSEEIPSYLGKAVLAITSMDSAKNVSPLHSKRGGILSLFSCQPPTWKTKLKPPTYRKSLFDNFHNASIKTEIDYLRDFLIRFKNLKLSIKDPKRKSHLERWVNNIIDEFLFYVGSIQNLPAGWTDTEGIKLKPAHQYLLDPYRMDSAFQSARQSTDWQKIIQTDFANWLNYQLRGKDKFTAKAEHTRLWKKLLETPLREYMEPIGIEVKQQRKEAL